MAKLVVVFLAAVLLYAQCLPLETSESTVSASSGLQLLVKNTSDATNYHLTPVIDELENIDDEINAELEAILPYINFLFDTLFSPPGLSQDGQPADDECLDNMVIQLVPDSSNDPQIPVATVVGV